MDNMESTIALAGNPNAGKTTLFNLLTGAHQHVGNYPGVTVEKKEGVCEHDTHKLNIVDLPGTYSLTAYSLEEVVARDFLVNEKPDRIINIVDASNLERNLYLTVQFMEMGFNVCIALNMIDVAQSRGVEIDADKLSDLLGMPVVPMIARKGYGKKSLLDATVKAMQENKSHTPLNISYGEDIEQVIDQMESIISADNFLSGVYHSRWIALKYLENDEQILKLGQKENPELSQKLQKIVLKVSNHLESTIDSYPEAEIADHRYGYIRSIIRQGVLTKRDENRLFVSDKIDKIVTNRLMGPIIMIAVLMGLYHFTFTYSEIPVQWFENFFAWLGHIINNILPHGLFKSMLISGIIDGVGGVLGFIPIIMFMFFGIALLEDSGYLARTAFMLDRIFKIFGLHGSSVMPFIISGGIAGGCAVPGILAARTLKSPRERLATLLTVPFMNCGAKLPVFALLVAAFFSEKKALIMFIITLISWAGALLVAWLLRNTIIKGEPTPFVMELPPYRLPTFKGLIIHTWERTWQYIKKAGTVILGISIILWAMMTFPQLPESKIETFQKERLALISQKPDSSISYNDKLVEIDSKQAEASLRYSVAGRIGMALEHISQFAGFNWRTNIALVGGFAAKEVIVSTLGTAYSLGENNQKQDKSLSKTLSTSPDWSPLVALSLIIFIIFYSPCFVAIVCIVKETGSWKWGAFSMIFNTVLAFGLATVVFQLGSLIKNLI